MVESLTTLKLVAAVPPKETAVAPVKLAPVIVIRVPAVVFVEDGDSPVMPGTVLPAIGLVIFVRAPRPVILMLTASRSLLPLLAREYSTKPLPR
jgi:hypothetical protein